MIAEVVVVVKQRRVLLADKAEEKAGRPKKAPPPTGGLKKPSDIAARRQLTAEMYRSLELPNVANTSVTAPDIQSMKTEVPAFLPL